MYFLNRNDNYAFVEKVRYQFNNCVEPSAIFLDRETQVLLLVRMSSEKYERYLNDAAIFLVCSTKEVNYLTDEELIAKCNNITSDYLESLYKLGMKKYLFYDTFDDPYDGMEC